MSTEPHLTNVNSKLKKKSSMIREAPAAFPGYPGSPYRRSPPGSPAPRAARTAGGARGLLREAGPPAGLLLCCCCARPPARGAAASALASAGVCVLVVGYTVLGAFVFMALEGGVHYDAAVAASKSNLGRYTRLVSDLRSRTVDRLWSITENLNILYRENWTRLAAEEVLEFQEGLVLALQGGGGGVSGGGGNGHVAASRDGAGYYGEHRWTFGSAFLYSLTLITTIGYGSVAPRTAWGKLATIIYALIGIPLVLVYLSLTGEVLARTFRRLYGKLCGSATAAQGPGDKGAGTGTGVRDCACADSVRVPVVICIGMVLGYVGCGAVLFHRLEDWTILEGSYFCFTSLGTIGFGDLVPGRHSTPALSLCACAAYILTGLALVAMCCSLLQDKVSYLLRMATGGPWSKPRGVPEEEEAAGGGMGTGS